MTNVTAILSMLHEPADRNSATRLFRGRPVLRWTLDRLCRCERLGTTAVVCWDDQAPAVLPVAADERAYVLAKGPRVALPEVQAVAAARRWSDNWRGPLLGACDFDLGFHALSAREVALRLKSDAVLLVDPAAGLVDPVLVDGVIAHAAAHPGEELVYAPAAPGLSGALLRPRLLDRLASDRTHPGRLAHDPTNGSRAPLPARVADTTHRFTLDSDRQLLRVGRATEPLNGELIRTEAEELVGRFHAFDAADPAFLLPREVVLELNTRRATRPVYSPAHDVRRPDLAADTAKRLFAELSQWEDTRLTVAGVGDPLLAPAAFDVLNAAAEAGIGAVRLETDLLGITPETVARLAAAPLDVVLVNLPAATAAAYGATMGVDGFDAASANVRLFRAARDRRGDGVPLLVPVFTRCFANAADVDAWRLRWVRGADAAVVRGGRPAPAHRGPCSRLTSRLTVISDGRIVSCEEDVTARQVLGEVGAQPLAEVWRQHFGPLRDDHRGANWAARPLCASCGAWHQS